MRNEGREVFDRINKMNRMEGRGSFDGITELTEGDGEIWMD
jgi:hypothetical protein